MVTLRSNNSGFSLHTVLIVLAAIAGVVIIGLFTKNQAEINKERKQFLMAQTEVNDLGAKLVKATNPDKHEAVAYCDYGHVKFGKGGRTCWAQYYLLYTNTDKAKATELFNEIKKLSSQKKEYSIRSSENMSSLESISFKSYIQSKCGAAIYYYENDNPTIGFPSFDQPKNSALVEIDCSGEANAEHFPVKE